MQRAARRRLSSGALAAADKRQDGRRYHPVHPGILEQDARRAPGDRVRFPHPLRGGQADPHLPGPNPDRRSRGSGGGPTPLLSGHMDSGAEMWGSTVDPLGAKFEDGWSWGMGAHDDKGGCVAAISAVEAIVRAGIRLRGDVIVTPVIAHKL